MRFRSASAVVLASIAAALSTAAGSAPAPPPPFVVHEWGTFTSIAGADGAAVQWFPPAAPSDLPRFVEHQPYIIKGGLCGSVRMETPVLYFYAPRDLDVDVGVRFRQGLITEWYPHAEGG